MADIVDRTQDFGTNSWLVEEMYEQFTADPSSVSEAWREFFSDYKSLHGTPSSVAVHPVAQGNGAPQSAAPSVPAPPRAPEQNGGAVSAPAAGQNGSAGSVQGEVIKGAGAAIVANMERSLTVPTATSFRNVPARLLEVNRKGINDYRSRHGLSKVSFTHIIAYAIVRAISDAVPVMRNSFAVGADGKPNLVRNPHVNVGLAVDVDKGDGTRNLVVPVLREADTMTFGQFLVAYDDLIRRVKANKLTIADFQGANVSITNPGTIGTVQSVPRLMPGQGVIVGVGSIDYPAEFQGADEANLNTLGISKVITITSTYDHRIIQGAESGLFLKRVHELLLGEHGFYEDAFRSLDIPYIPSKWSADTSPLNREESLMDKQMQVATLVRVHRVRGHLLADIDPLRWNAPELPKELDPATYGITIWDLEREFLTGGVAGSTKMKLHELLEVLRDAYCRTIGIEYMHIQNTDEQRWIQSKVEGVTWTPTLDQKLRILERLNAAEAFEKFLATKYVGTKRFGLEGAESMIPLIDEIVSAAADEGLNQVIFGMPHRGRLNVLANIMGKSYNQIFKEFEGHISPDSVQGSGDVKYHLGAHGTHVSPAGSTIEMELAANPSHLETVNGVVLGMARAVEDRPGAEEFDVLPVLMHGDAAFAGQGIVAEGLAMSGIEGYSVGGTIHLIVNNQIGYTTSPADSRSSLYASDIAKSVQAPIFHVNGDDPEACVRVARLAFEYRQRFHKDVVIDMICYRLHGHNEGDDPSYTQPLMYKAIAEKRPVRKLYVESLVKRGDISLETAEQALADYQQKLQGALDDARANAPEKRKAAKPPAPVGVQPHVDTGIDRGMFDTVFRKLTDYPEGFVPHPKLVRQFDARVKQMEADGDFEWAIGEALAYGSLLLEGFDVRLAGEDARRGTFAHRHAALVDYENERKWVPLAELPGARGRFWVYDSLLSEYAALAFEYGYAHANRDALVLWEGQFGDFVNGAQIVIDQYIVAAEDKWKQQNGLVMLLPHGYEGQGPEHSSARIERFLQLCAEDNIQVVNATTAAQFFHVLRRQLHRDIRKPLVIFTPKAPLRMKETRSRIEDILGGTSFQEVLDDHRIPDRNSVRRVVLCSGKVAWDAMAERDSRNAPVAVVRVEQLYPFPVEQIDAAIAAYPNAKEVVWLQEEPENMGPWHFVEHRIWRLKERGYDLRHVSRVESGSPATGSKAISDQELADLMDDTFAGM